MLKPLRRIASSVAFAGQERSATAKPPENMAASTVAFRRNSEGYFPIIFFPSIFFPESLQSSEAHTDRRCAKLVRDVQRQLFSIQNMLHRRGYAIFGIRAGKLPTPPKQFFGCISHDKRVAGKGKHFYIVIVIANGHDLLGRYSPVTRPARQGVAFGTAGIEHIDDR